MVSDSSRCGSVASFNLCSNPEALALLYKRHSFLLSIDAPQKQTITTMYNIVEETPVDTCYRVQCDTCGKTTWKVRNRQSHMLLFFSHMDTGQGCGAHVEQVSRTWCEALSIS